VPHNYLEMPPLWRLEEILELTDEHPSALKKVETGKFVTRRNKVSGFYEISIDNEVFLAHRIVYYMRTGQCPDGFCVKHGPLNREKDNREELVQAYRPRPYKRKPSWSWN